MSELIRKIEHALNYSESNLMTDVLNDCLQALSDEWISIDDRSPKKSGPYMTFNGGDDKPSCIQQRVHIYDSDYKWFNSDTVTHWKPLPEPPINKDK